MSDERRISRATSLLIISCFILKSKSILENLQEMFLRRNLCKILGDAVVWNDGMGRFRIVWTIFQRTGPVGSGRLLFVNRSKKVETSLTLDLLFEVD